MLRLQLRWHAGLVPGPSLDSSFKLPVTVSAMTYEAWTALNNASVIAVVTAPLLLAIVVFLVRHQRRDANGKRTGRAVLSAVGAAFGSFVVFVFAWYLAVHEAFPDHSARWRAESEQRQRQQPRTRDDDADVIDGIVGQWRPNNRNRTDYFAFTTETYSSINPDYDTTITYAYEVMRRDGSCMRIRSTHVTVAQSGQVTRKEPTRGDPFIVCVDPETDLMVMRFDSDQGDVFFVRMN